MKTKRFVFGGLLLLLITLGFLIFGGEFTALNVLAIIIVLFGIFGWAVPQLLGRLNPKVWIYIGLIFLILFMIPSKMFVPNLRSDPLFSLLGVTLFLLFPLALIVIALLLDSGIRFHLTPKEPSVRLAVVCLGLAFLLLARMMYSLYWLMVWDSTDDGLGYLWLFIPLVTVLFSGLMLVVALPGRAKLTGILYILLLAALMIGDTALAQRVDFREETTQRAERTVQAIESYYAREGHYPTDLAQLSPRYLLSLPDPMIIYGQNWCYEGGNDHFSLGYVYREHWSNPNLIGRIYKTVGQNPEINLCEKEVVQLIRLHPWMTASQ